MSLRCQPCGNAARDLVKLLGLPVEVWGRVARFAHNRHLLGVAEGEERRREQEREAAVARLAAERKRP